MRPAQAAVSLLFTAMAMVACAGGCAATETPSDRTIMRWPSNERPIVIDQPSRTVRFAGIVPIDASQKPMLEVLVCTPDSREHEALVMAEVRPSHIHAALIALGAEPGQPGGLIWNGTAFSMREPTGMRIGVRLAADETHPEWTDAREWFSAAPLQEFDSHWLFTGSTTQGGVYAADSDGTIVGLVSFTTEVIGMAPAVTEMDAERGFDFFPVPDWVPAFGTRVIVELRLLD